MKKNFILHFLLIAGLVVPCTVPSLQGQSYLDQLSCLEQEDKKDLQAMFAYFNAYLKQRYALEDKPREATYHQFAADTRDQRTGPDELITENFPGMIDQVNRLALFRNLYSPGTRYNQSAVYACLLRALPNEDLRQGLSQLKESPVDMNPTLVAAGYAAVNDFSEEATRLLFCLDVFYPLASMFAPKLDQRVELPELKGLTDVPDRQRLIPLNLYYDPAGRLMFGFDEQAYSDMDSLKSYLLPKLREKEVIDRIRVAVAIVADQDIKMEDVSLIQEELKRFELLRVFFVGRAAAGTPFPLDWNRGLYYKLPPRDEEHIEQFYRSRNLAPREPENLIMMIYQAEEAQREREDPDDENSMAPPPLPPPPPPPPPPLPRKYDPLSMDGIPGLQMVVIDITNAGQYVVNDQALEATALYPTIAGFLNEGECMFALRPAAGAPYGKYVQVIDAVSLELAQLREKEALRLYGKRYDQLGYSFRRRVNQQYPLMIIDEPVYYRAGE